ncbi:MAG TPA: potassium transporter Kup [Thermoanaerobaculia bacterium]|nr:potassium transporter Kup [Thermoanaerobaculia bacterium]
MGQPAERTSPRYLLVLSLGALGVVYGDIGTSPLYALRECFHPHHGVRPTPDNVIGILSLIFWSLTIVISFKYLVFVMRADNRGEGGILALMSLVRARGSGSSQARLFLVALGLFGAALLYGDGMITPAISVLSAIEGIDVATPVFGLYIVPVTIVVLIILFLLQRAGTARVGAVFGPVMLVWFAVIAILGVMQIVQEPHVLAAINPAHAFAFFARNRLHGFLVLGAVFLCVTGGEALYADMGHFGARPIRLAWFILVFPCLLLNYFGQGALLLHDPAAAEHPFFHMAPAWARLPLVVLATLATIIASQAVISGAFSLTRQAVQLGYAPRLDIRQTSAREIGQIYIASVNWALMVCAIGLVLAFRSSSALAAAYGVAVTATMGITTALLAVVERERWNWSIPAMLALTIPLLIIDLSFFGANIIKVTEGGWFPLVVGIFVFTLLATWRRGRELLAARLAESMIPIETLLREVARGTLARVRGTAIFLSRYPEGIPTTLLHNMKHNKVLHEHVILLTVSYEETAHLRGGDERHQWQDLGSGIYRLRVRFGYMEETNIPSLLASIKDAPIPLDPAAVSFFLGHETLIATRRPGMALWRENLFSWMIRNASSATHWFRLPANQVIELGAQIEL